MIKTAIPPTDKRLNRFVLDLTDSEVAKLTKLAPKLGALKASQAIRIIVRKAIA